MKNIEKHSIELNIRHKKLDYLMEHIRIRKLIKIFYNSLSKYVISI